MAHGIEEVNGQMPMAFVGEVPWHGLGQQMPTDAPIEEWTVQAGMNWDIKSGPALFKDDDDVIHEYPERLMLRRSDNNFPLSIVSSKYKIVQPSEIMGFFKDLVDAGNLKMSTAGVLYSGRKFWALAELGESARIMGQDRLDGYLLLSTSCDGSLATTAMFTSIRVVCNNTLGFAIRDGEQGHARRYLKVPHSAKFDADQVKAELGLAHGSWETYINAVNQLAERNVGDKEAVEYYIRLFTNMKDDEEITEELLEKADTQTIDACFELYKGLGKGALLRSANGTAWGLVNAVTEYCDHHRNTQSQDARLNSTWFGASANLKQRAFDNAIKLVAA